MLSQTNRKITSGELWSEYLCDANLNALPVIQIQKTVICIHPFHYFISNLSGKIPETENCKVKP